MRFYIVTEFQIQHMFDLVLDSLIFHRENDLHTTIKITWHPVCTSHVDLIGTTIMEIENPAVLQEIADNGTHMDIFTDTRNAHLQTADTTNQKIDLYTAGRSVIQCRHDRRVTQGIHLRHNVGLFSVFRMLCFSLDHFYKTVFHPDGRNDQTVPAFRLGISGKHVKDSRCILTKPLITGKNTAVCIKFGCGIVIVSGCQMDISADSVFFSSHNKGDLAVCLQSYQTINYMTACFFQHFGPDDIVFLVKTCFQLHKNRNLLAVFCCLSQRCNDGGIAADTIQCLLDCQYIRIFCRLAHKIHHRIKAHIWMMQEHIPFPDHLENVFIILKCRYCCRFVLRLLELIISIDTINLHQHGQIQRSVDKKDVISVNLKFHFQNIQKPRVHLIFHFQTDHFAPLTLFQLFLDLHQKILRLILIDGKICITHDPVRMCTDHIVA